MIRKKENTKGVTSYLCTKVVSVLVFGSDNASKPAQRYVADLIYSNTIFKAIEACNAIAREVLYFNNFYSWPIAITLTMKISSSWYCTYVLPLFLVHMIGAYEVDNTVYMVFE